MEAQPPPPADFTLKRQITNHWDIDSNPITLTNLKKNLHLKGGYYFVNILLKLNYKRIVIILVESYLFNLLKSLYKSNILICATVF